MNKLILSLFIFSGLNAQQTDSLKVSESDSLKIEESKIVSNQDSISPVSYTHLTLPTTPYV